MTHPALEATKTLSVDRTKRPDNPVIDNLDESKPEKPTMIRVWQELSQDELQGLAMLAGIELGQMSLTKISTILKAIHYKHNPLWQTVNTYATVAPLYNAYQGYQSVGNGTGQMGRPIPNQYAPYPVTQTLLTGQAQTPLNTTTTTTNNTAPTGYSTLLNDLWGKAFGV